MSAQATTENTGHPTPPHTEPHDETSEAEVPERRRQETQEESGRQPAKPKTETEEKIERETPSLSAESAASDVDGAQQNPGNHVARRPKRHNVAKRGKDHASGQTYQPQDGQQVAPPQNQQAQSKGKGAPSVRLDMDLDVEIDLKAKIKGDIELSILGGKQGRR